MANARFAYNNLLTAGGVVISSSSEATGYPDDNLANPARWKRWRSATNTSDQWIKFDLGANTSFQLLALVSAKKHTGGTIKFQANATDAWGAPTVDQTITVPSLDVTRVWTYWLPASQSLRWFRFYFTNSGAVSDYAEVGVAFAGPYFEPSKQISRNGLGLVRLDESEILASLDGQEFAQARTRYFGFSGQYLRLPEADITSFRTMDDAVGLVSPFIFGLDPTDMTRTLYARLRSPLQEEYVRTGRWNVPIELQEYR